MNHPHKKDSDKILILDVETNGIHPMSSILTLSAIMYEYENGRRIADIDLQFRPEGDWNEESETFHGISNTTASRFPDPEKSLKRFHEWCNEHGGSKKPIALGCHALNITGYFDWGVLLYTYMKHRNVYEFYEQFSHTESTIDFLRDAVKKSLLDPVKAINSAGQSYSSYKLNLWADRFNIELDHHDAKSDAEACAEIYWKLRNIHTTDLSINREDKNSMTLL